MATRYLLDRDDDGHWYLMPETDREAFGAFVFDGADQPTTVVRLAGSPSNVTFEAPMEFGEPMVVEPPALPADEHHYDVACDDRPHCQIPQHHALEDMP